jgi:hypothetical protein
MIKPSRFSSIAKTGILLMAGLVIAITAISEKSFWIDEANSAIKALEPTWSGFLGRMSVDRGSDLQMPGYMAALWVWEKITGPKEFALRSMNAPLFLGALCLVCFMLRITMRRKVFFVLFACSSSFLWIYLDEVRPYILQFLGASLTMIGLYNMVLLPCRKMMPRDSILALLGLVILLSSSLSTIIFTALYGALLFYLIVKNFAKMSLLNNRPFICVAISSVIISLLLAVYYYWTLGTGARASSVGKTNALSMVFCFYELAGFSGFGPGRGDLRASPILALKSHIPFLAIYATSILAFGFLCFTPISRRLSGLTKPIMLLISVVLIGVVMMFILGMTTHFRVLGRHLMPAFPFIVLAVSIGADHAIKMHKKVGWLMVSIIIFLMFASSLIIRFSDYHAKDDYRGAAMQAKTSILKGGTVWWAADTAGAHYYAVPIKHPESDLKGVYLTVNPTEAELDKFPSPDTVILSKADIYDNSGSLQEWLRSHGYLLSKKLQSFSVYSRPE